MFPSLPEGNMENVGPTSYRNTDLYRNTHEYRGITEIQIKINDNDEKTSI